MQFGQIEREGLDTELWSLWQRGQSPDYLHLSLRQRHESHVRWQSQHRESDRHSIRSNSRAPWLVRLLGWNGKR